MRIAQRSLLATTTHPSIMVLGNFIPPQMIQMLFLHKLSRKMEEMLMQMKAILTVPQEEIGGKDHSIIKTSLWVLLMVLLYNRNRGNMMTRIEICYSLPQGAVK